MKKILYLVSLIVIISIAVVGCGGGGGTGIDLPGVGIPDKIVLKGSSYIAQTNGSITLEAEVSYKGRAVKDVDVVFTNISPIGHFCDGVKNTATTNDLGKATIRLCSTTPGFATVQAEIEGADYVRTRSSFYFTTAIVIYPFLSLSIDGDGNGFYNEPDDFILIANGRDTATLKAELQDATGTPLVGRTILFSTDTTFIDCTVESCAALKQPYAQEIVFPNGRTAWTNGDGKATIEIIASSKLKEFRTSFNVSAMDTYSGASDLFTVFLDPITVGTVTVVADPPVIERAKTSKVTTCAYSTAPDPFNVGVPVPDGTIIQLSATDGIIAPFVQTIDGCATITYTAPSTPVGEVTITATVGGVSGSTTVIVTTELTVLPPTQTITAGARCAIPAVNSASYTITGGAPSYSVYTNRPDITSFTAPTAGDSTTVTSSGGTFTIAYDVATTEDATVTITVQDSLGAIKTASFVINCP